jgi:hypothetical protein
LAPSLVLLSVTALLLFYGRYPWSWLGGPVASLFVWSLDRKAREPSEPAASRIGREATLVD